jgi:hypothetical protein
LRVVWWVAQLTYPENALWISDETAKQDESTADSKALQFAFAPTMEDYRICLFMQENLKAERYSNDLFRLCSWDPYF